LNVSHEADIYVVLQVDESMPEGPPILEFLEEANGARLRRRVVRDQDRYVLGRVLKNCSKALGEKLVGAMDRDADGRGPSLEREAGAASDRVKPP